MSDLAIELRSISGKPRWDGLPGASFVKYTEDVQDYFVGKGIAAVLFQEEFDLPELGGDPLKLANASVFSTLRKSLPPEIVQSITDEHNDAAAIGSEDEDTAKLLGTNAVKLWAAIVKKSHGPISATAGYDLQAAIRVWKFPTDPTLTHVERAAKAISTQSDLVRRAAALGDARFPHTQAQGCNAIIDDLPSILALNKRQYRPYCTLAVLGAELAVDSVDFDTKPHLVAMAAALSGPDDHTVLAASHDRHRGGGGAGGEPPRRKRVTIDATRRMDKSKGPPWEGSVWCSAHGWCGHTDDRCNKKTSTTTALVTVDPSDDDVRYRRLANGDFERVLMFKMKPNVDKGLIDSHDFVPTPTPTPVCSAAVLSATTSGSALDPRCPILYVDCGGSISIVWSTDTDGVIAGSEVWFAKPRSIGGIGSGVLALGRCRRVIAMAVPGTDKVLTLEIQPLISPASSYEILATNSKGLCGAGISSKQDAQLPGCPIVLEPHHLDLEIPDNKLWCVPHDGLWAAPLVPTGHHRASPGQAQLIPRWDVAEKACVIASSAPASKPGVPLLPLHPRVGGIVCVNTATLSRGVGHPPIGGVVRGGTLACTNGSTSSHVDAVRADPSTSSLNPIPPPHVGIESIPPPTTTASERFATFAARIGGGSDTAVARLAARAGMMLTHRNDADAIAIKTAVQLSTQAAVPVSMVDGSPSPSHDHSFGVDTLGGKFPRSYIGNHYAVTYVDHAPGKRDPTVAVFATHHATNTVSGLVAWLQESGFALKLDGTLQPHITAFLDNGTELRGEFSSLLERHGVKINRSTAYKHNTARTGIIENCNRELQRKMRINIAAAAGNFDKFGLNKTQFWDYAIQHAARQIKVQHILDNVDPTNAAATSAARKLVKRMLPFPFGAVTAMTLQLGSPERSASNKQLADRSSPCLFLGVDSDNRFSVITAAGKVHHTIDVRALPVPHGSTFSPLSATDIQLLSEGIMSSEIVGSDNTVSPGAQVDVLNGGAPAQNAQIPIPSMEVGVFAHVGDRVAVYWPAEKQTFAGTIIDQDPYGDFKHQKTGVPIAGYEVLYDEDQSRIWHRVDDASEQVRVLETHVAVAVDVGNILAYNPVLEFNTGLCCADDTVLAARTFQPHASIAKYIDDRGQILRELLLGDTDLPPMPPLPPYARSTTQPPPLNTRQALEGPDALFWLEGMIIEHAGHVKTPTFKFVDLDESAVARDGLNARWVYAYKWDGDKIAKFRSRLVLAGYDRVKGVHYKDTYLSAPPIDTLRALECIAIYKRWLVYESDLTRAYAHAFAEIQPNGHAVSARMPNISRIFIEGSERAIEAIRAMYGFPAAGFEFGKWFTKALTSDSNPIPLRQNLVQPCLYAAVWPPGHRYAGEYYIVYVHSDNVIHFTSSEAVHRDFMVWYTVAMTVTGGDVPLNRLEPTTRLGMTVTYTANSVAYTMSAYAEKLLTAHGMQDCNPASTPLPPGFHMVKADQPDTAEDRAAVTAYMNKAFGRNDHSYADTVSSFASSMQGMNWFATMVSPGLRTAISLTACASHNPSIKAIKAVKQMLRWVRGKAHDGLTYTRTRVYGKHEFPRPEYSSDASFNDHIDSGKSQGGVVGRYDGGAATFFTSRRSGHVCTSTAHAEVYFGSEAARQIVYEHQMFLDLRFSMPSPARLQMDNRSAIIDAGSEVRKFSQRQKHYLLSERYLHQTKEAGILVIEHRSGALLDADAMTKALPAATLNQHVRTLEHGFHVPANVEG